MEDDVEAKKKSGVSVIDKTMAVMFVYAEGYDAHKIREKCLKLRRYP
jgi:hypothetical protein